MRKPFFRQMSGTAVAAAVASSLLLMSAPKARADEQAPAPAAATTDDAYRAAYKALPPDELSKHKIDALPQLELRRIDASEHMRSSSFGHKTTVLVPPDNGPKREFYVELGRSTNKPATYYGPFPLSSR